jgi:hypothetical protein
MRKTFNGEIKYFSKKVLDYFLVFFAGLVSGAAAFLGLPLPGTFRIASSADSGYIASFVNGLIPAVSRRLCAVLYGISSRSAISCIVKPFIVIAHYRHKISKLSTKTIRSLSGFVKNFIFLSKFSIFFLDINIEKFYIYE